MKSSLITFLLVTLTSLVINADPTPAVVDKFYSSMEAMSDAPNDIKAKSYLTEIMNCFKGREHSGIPVPNDFKLWGFEDEQHVTANIYSRRFYELAYKQKKVKMKTPSILNSQYVNEAELANFKNKKSNQYIQTIAKKTLTDGKVSKTYIDTLIVENEKIVIFKNNLYNDGENIDIEALRALAASYYSTRQYNKAFQTYERIIHHDPDNGNAYYRIAILTYMGKGCKKDRKKAIQYAEKAYRLRYLDAERLIYYITNTPI